MIEHEAGPPRTFVRREGRITPGQKRALTELLPQYDYPLDGRTPAQIFGRVASLVVEIGFGNGENLAAQAAAHPQTDFIGLEVHRPGVGTLLQSARDLGLSNLRVSSQDATEFLRATLPPASADVIQIFFPDPWPKKRHHKRRMVRPDVLDCIAACLRPEGELLLATDWDNYAEQMLAELEAHPALVNREAAGGSTMRADRVLTRFERRAHRLGHRIHDFAFRRRGPV